MSNNDNEERQQAELEFIQAAYSSDEAWCTIRSAADDDVEATMNIVHRRLNLPLKTTTSRNGSSGSCCCCCCCWELHLRMPPGYPGEGGETENGQDEQLQSSMFLQVTGLVDQERTTSDNATLRVAFDRLPDLLQVCRDAAGSAPGEEAVLLVLNAADEWIATVMEEEEAQNGLVSGVAGGEHGARGRQSSSPSDVKRSENRVVLLGRRLIYSHHIIAKQKRSDLQHLASEYHLTGYVKIGWPGLIIIEGLEEDCQQFYDEVRQWSWQYLVVRGEMQEPLYHHTSSHPDANDQNAAATRMMLIQQARRFDTWQEVDDMSIVAQHCRQVGLEALFRTSMKVYSSGGDDDDQDAVAAAAGPTSNNNTYYYYYYYGALIHVDHMNHGKAYRKWLRRTCQEYGVDYLLIQQCYPQQDYTKKPTILVGLIEKRQQRQQGGKIHENPAEGGAGSAVATVLQQWRTRKVDVDSRGKACLERKMTVLTQGPLMVNSSSSDKHAMALETVSCSSSNGDNNGSRSKQDDGLHTTREKLMRLLHDIGGDDWVHATASLWHEDTAAEK